MRITASSTNAGVGKDLSLRIAFQNTSLQPLVIMNHFGVDAWGPTFYLVVESPAFPDGCEWLGKHISFSEVENQWIEISPGEEYILDYPVLFEETGMHQVQAAYASEAGLVTALAKRQPPRNLWQGRIMSAAIQIVVENR